MRTLDCPKSLILTSQLSFTRMLRGFRSLWIIPFWWRYKTPFKISNERNLIWFVLIFSELYFITFIRFYLQYSVTIFNELKLFMSLGLIMDISFSIFGWSPRILRSLISLSSWWECFSQKKISFTFLIATTLTSFWNWFRVRYFGFPFFE